MSTPENEDLPEPPEIPEPYQPLHNQDKYEGMEAHLVPEVPPGPNPQIDQWEACNAKKTETLSPEDIEERSLEFDGEGYRTIFKQYCKAKAGSGTDHNGEGRCKWHGGNAGAPPHNQNGLKNASSVDPHHYAQSLNPGEKEFLRDSEAAILDRIRKLKGEVDFLDRILARRIGVQLHIVAKESDYVENVSGLTQVISGEHGSHEDKSALLDDIRKRDKDIISMLKSIGVLDDPESKKADALESWRDWVEDGSTSGSNEEIIDLD